MTTARISKSGGFFSMACGVELNIQTRAIAHALPPESDAEKHLKRSYREHCAEGA
jgi:hypothetical protein